MVFRQRNSQRFEMDMSAAEVKRAASAQPQSPSAEPNGSEILVRCLQAEGVKFLWGYPGGAVLYIYDALYKQQKSAIDPKERQQIVFQMQALAFNDRPYIILTYDTRLDAWSPKWDGFVESTQGIFNNFSTQSLTQVHQA